MTTSIQIKKASDGGKIEILGSVGDGDNKITLLRLQNGSEVLETNGEPVWEGEQGFSEVRAQIIGE